MHGTLVNVHGCQSSPASIGSEMSVNYAQIMPAMSAVRTSNFRRVRLGAILYVSTLQYFLVQLLVSLRWSPPYSVSRNTISDLGNTTCGKFNARYVCSPLHSLMNVSFVLLGLAMIGGSLLVSRNVPATRARVVGFTAIAVGGVGAVTVGIFPENTIPAFHGIGASLPFLVGNIGLLVLGLARGGLGALRFYTVLSGSVALIFLVPYAVGQYIGFGEGGIERVVAYPQTVWLIVLGVYLIVTKPSVVVNHFADAGNDRRSPRST
jgi:hypothetical membrane protein